MDSAADLRGIDILHCSWRGAAGIRRPASGSQSKRQYPDLEHRQGSVTGPSTRWWSTALGHSAICAARVSARATVPHHLLEIRIEADEVPAALAAFPDAGFLS
jgi:hypothetical protein